MNKETQRRIKESIKPKDKFVPSIIPKIGVDKIAKLKLKTRFNQLLNHSGYAISYKGIPNTTKNFIHNKKFKLSKIFG